MKIPNTQEFKSQGLLVAIFLLVFVVSAWWANIISLIFKSIFSVNLVFLLSLISSIFIFKKICQTSLKEFFKTIFFSSIIIVLCCLFSLNFYDISYDGQTYQLEAILRISNGWNPIWDANLDFTSHPVDSHGTNVIPSISIMNDVINHFPKFTWIFSSLLYSLTGKIEITKLHNLLLPCISILLCQYFLLLETQFTKSLRIVFSIILAISPINILQSLTNYVDASSYSLILISCLLFYFWLKEIRGMSFLLLMAITALLNVKFTSFVSGLILMFGALAWLAINKNKRTTKFLAICSLSILLACLILGFSPYVKNLKQTGKLFYPISEYKLDGITPKGNLVYGQLPTNFKNLNRFAKLATSLFSRSQNPLGPEKTKLKLPFTVSMGEIKEYKNTALRIGNMGPLFTFALILSFLILIQLALKKKSVFNLVFFLITVSISILINPEAWWLRYVAQIWLIPILIIIWTLNYQDEYTLKVQSYLILAVLFLNNFLISYSYFPYQYQVSKMIENQNKLLKSMSQPTKINLSTFLSNRARLKELGINYLEVPGNECKSQIIIPASRAVICN